MPRVLSQVVEAFLAHHCHFSHNFFCVVDDRGSSLLYSYSTLLARCDLDGAVWLAPPMRLGTPGAQMTKSQRGHMRTALTAFAQAQVRYLPEGVQPRRVDDYQLGLVEPPDVPRYSVQRRSWLAEQQQRRFGVALEDGEAGSLVRIEVG